MKKKLSILAAALFALVMIPATPASATTAEYEWDMVNSGAWTDVWVYEAGSGGRDIELFPAPSEELYSWAALPNSIRWQAATSWGDVAYSAQDEPGTANFALGARITVDYNSATGNSNYTGKVIQFGKNVDPGYIQLEVVPAQQGTFRCNVGGDNGYTSVTPAATFNVDENGTDTYSVLCFRQGESVGILVDDTTDAVEGYVEDSSEVDVGDIDPGRNITLGNRGSAGGVNNQHLGKNYCSGYAYGSGSVNYVEDLLEAGC